MRRGFDKLLYATRVCIASLIHQARLFSFLLIGIMVGSGVAQSQPSPQAPLLREKAMQAIRSIDRASVKQGIAAGTMLLIDVREPHEFAEGHIPGALSMPLSRFDATKIPVVEGKEVVFSCRSGRRTLEAIRLSHDAGKNYSTHYAGSMLDWLQAGEAVEKGE